MNSTSKCTTIVTILDQNYWHDDSLFSKHSNTIYLLIFRYPDRDGIGRTEEFTVRVGLYSQLDLDHSQHIQVSERIAHPDYINEEHTSDIAVLKLAEDIIFNVRAAPVCIPTTRVPDNTSCIISGFGTLDGMYIIAVCYL